MTTNHTHPGGVNDLNDAQLTEQVCNALDASIDATPSDTEQTLSDMRRKALQQSVQRKPRRTRPVYLTAVAAALLAIIVFPLINNPVEEPALTYLDVDPDMLAMMDMLIILEELDVDASDAI